MSAPSSVTWPPSLWAATAPPGPALAAPHGRGPGRCRGDRRRFHRACPPRSICARPAVDVVVLEAAEPGWGASGRNNGQVIPTLAGHDPSAMVKRHGAAGERFNAVLRDSAQYLFDTVAKYGIAAEAEQAGWVQPVHSPGRFKLAEKRVREWSAIGAPVELLDRAADGADARQRGLVRRLLEPDRRPYQPAGSDARAGAGGAGARRHALRPLSRQRDELCQRPLDGEDAGRAR